MGFNRTVLGAAIIVTIVIVLGAWYYREKPSSPTTISVFTFDKSFSLNQEQNTQSGGYPNLYASWTIQLLPGNYRMTLHTSDTVTVFVCGSSGGYCTGVHLVNQSFSSSEVPPNVADFTVNSVSGGSYTITVQICNSVFGSPINCSANNANGTISLVKL